MTDNYEQLRAIANTIRLQVVEALELRGTLTTSQLSKITGDRSMTPHLKALESAELIEQVGPDLRRRTEWRLKPADGPVVSWTQEQANDPELTALVRLVERLGTYRRLDRMRSFDEETKSGVWPEVWAEAAIGRDWLMTVTPAQLEVFEAAVNEAIRGLRSESSRNRETERADTEDVFITLNAFPIKLGDI